MGQFPGPGLSPHASAAQRREHAEAVNKWIEDEARRVARQRAAFLDGTAWRRGRRDSLVECMLERAWSLLDAGECEAADALLEFVPEPRARALLDDFFGDDA